MAPASLAIVAGPASGSTSVTAPAGCAWTGVSNNTGWLTVTSGASGSGNGSVGFSATANASATQRVGTLTVAGQPVTVTQAGVGCTFTMSSNSLSVTAAGGTGSTNVTAPAGCPWSAAANDTWITVTSGGSGSGNGSAGFSVAANPNASARTGTLTIASQTFTVSQAAAACTYTLTPTSQPMSNGGGSGSTSVTAPNGCAWTAANNAAAWLTITGGATGNGNGTVTYTALSNPNAQPRSGTLTIGGQTFTVNQAAATCDYTLTPTSQTILATGGTGSSGVTALAGCAWTAVSNNTSWLTITGGASGNGDGTVSFSVTANTSTQQRTGTLTIAGQTFTVTQNAGRLHATRSRRRARPWRLRAGTYPRRSRRRPGAAGRQRATPHGSTSPPARSGSGAGSTSFTVAPSTSTAQRTGSLTIAGPSVHRDPVGQHLHLHAHAGEPDADRKRRVGHDHCRHVERVHVGSVDDAVVDHRQRHGTASGSASYTVQPNTTGSNRTGAISIGTQVFAVIQGTGSGTAPVAPGGLRIVAVGGSD